MEQLLTVAQVAERLGVSKAAVYALCARENTSLRHLRIGVSGATIRIPEDAFREYIDRATVEPSLPEWREPPRSAAPLQYIRSRG